MPKKIHTPFFRELSAVGTFCLQKQVVFVKWIHSLLEAPQSRLSDSRCIELKCTASLLCGPFLWHDDTWKYTIQSFTHKLSKNETGDQHWHLSLE